MDLNLDNLRDSWAEFRRDIAARVFDAVERIAPRSNARKASTAALSAEAALKVPLPDTRVPDGVTVYAVGDVHGRADLLKRLCEKINEDAAGAGPDNQNAIVFLGDYVDRGFQSRDVIDFLMSDAFEGFEVRFLKGNHEEALLRFLRDSTFGPRWAEFGGVETLVSYNVQPPRGRERLDEWEVARAELARRMPDSHRMFLERLELCLVLGDYTFVHAGLRPGKRLEDQSEKDLLWIRDEFLYDKAPFENVVVHGHTPIPAPYRDFRRISVDTGAYLSGRLSAVRLHRDDVSFITT